MLLEAILQTKHTKAKAAPQLLPQPDHCPHRLSVPKSISYLPRIHTHIIVVVVVRRRCYRRRCCIIREYLAHLVLVRVAFVGRSCFLSFVGCPLYCLASLIPNQCLIPSLLSLLSIISGTSLCSHQCWWRPYRPNVPSFGVGLPSTHNLLTIQSPPSL